MTSLQPTWIARPQLPKLGPGLQASIERDPIINCLTIRSILSSSCQLHDHSKSLPVRATPYPEAGDHVLRHLTTIRSSLSSFSESLPTIFGVLSFSRPALHFKLLASRSHRLSIIQCLLDDRPITYTRIYATSETRHFWSTISLSLK